MDRRDQIEEPTRRMVAQMVELSGIAGPIRFDRASLTVTTKEVQTEGRLQKSQVVCLKWNECTEARAAPARASAESAPVWARWKDGFRAEAVKTVFKLLIAGAAIAVTALYKLM
jgi:hypothetical protein